MALKYFSDIVACNTNIVGICVSICLLSETGQRDLRICRSYENYTASINFHAKILSNLGGIGALL
jgi:hypothetical protein